MAGLIRAEDIAAVKERTSIEDVVREHVTLRRAGAGSLKGLCPFHDEKTPSFHVRPAVGRYKCFGCGASGDVVEFIVQVEHLTFVEAVERLAEKLGVELHREDGDGRPERSGPKRSRLVDAHRVAQEFYAEALLDRDRHEARAARDFLRERGFDGDIARQFGLGFAPRGGDEIARLLRDRGFTDEELVVAGLCGRGSRGLYDRFRGRLLWPIHDITGEPVGFGARRLFDDDRIGAKYLNTAETPIYKKSSVLYGLDTAKKSISRDRVAVIVEGYTDVMAAHLSGVEGAVATCGTAFGVDHIKILRRIMRDEAGMSPAKVIFTFDGDAAGQKAAMRAFSEDQRWASQSFVAVAEEGMDPCDLRLAKGPDAVRQLVDDAVPMFEFVVRTTIDRFDLETAEGRVGAMTAVAPVIRSIRDTSLQPEYIRTVAGWIGVEVAQVSDAVRRAARLTSTGGPDPHRTPASTEDVPEPSEQEAGIAALAIPLPDLRDPVVLAERQLLQCLLQFPAMVAVEAVDAVPGEAFAAPAHRAVFDGIRAAGSAAGISTAAWVARVSDAVPTAVNPLVTELAVAPLPTIMDAATGLPERRYVAALLARVHEVALTRQIADAMSSMRRMASSPDEDPARARDVAQRLQNLQRELADIRAAMN